jgi:hypothetical protein
VSGSGEITAAKSSQSLRQALKKAGEHTASPARRAVLLRAEQQYDQLQAATRSTVEAAETAASKTAGGAAEAEGVAARRSASAVETAVQQSEKTAAKAAGELAEGVATASKGAAALKTVAKAAPVVAVVGVETYLRGSHAMELNQQYQQGAITYNQLEVEQTKNVAGGLGGLAGAWAGAELGAAGGAAAGSIVPGPGTAIGGFAGAVGGGVAGYFGGEKAAEAGSEWAVQKLHASGQTISNVASAAWTKTKSGASYVGGSIAAGWNASVNTVRWWW